METSDAKNKGHPGSQGAAGGSKKGRKAGKHPLISRGFLPGVAAFFRGKPLIPRSLLLNGRNDYTLYFRRADCPSEFALGAKEYSRDTNATIDGIPARVCVCACDNGESVSVTLRLQRKGATSPGGTDFPMGSGALPSEWAALDEMDVLCEDLHKLLLRQTPTGLVVVSGRTGSRKSVTARGMICRYLRDKIGDTKRRPHLIALEDPVETRFCTSDLLLRESKRRVDYTLRVKGKDYDDLGAALDDAKRQTPTVVFVGEIRTKRDWEVVVDFAGTGHLIVTTAHAGSVTETFTDIFRAYHASSPAEQGVAAHRVLGIVHLKPFFYDEKTVVLPAVWVRKPGGLAALLANGLSSLLPHCPADAVGVSTLGRRSFLHRLFRQHKARLDAMAILSDLEGL